MRKALFIACSLIILASCKEPELPTYNTNVKSSKEVMLTSGGHKDWLIDKMIVDGQDITHTEFEPCDLDDFFRFVHGGARETWEGGNKCDSSGTNGMLGSGVWAFSDDESQLLPDGEPFLIQELTDLKFSLKMDDGFEVFEITFKAR